MLKYMSNIITEPSTYAGLASVMIGVSQILEASGQTEMTKAIGVIIAGAVAIFREESHAP